MFLEIGNFFYEFKNYSVEDLPNKLQTILLAYEIKSITENNKNLRIRLKDENYENLLNVIKNLYSAKLVEETKKLEVENLSFIIDEVKESLKDEKVFVIDEVKESLKDEKVFVIENSKTISLIFNSQENATDFYEKNNGELQIKGKIIKIKKVFEKKQILKKNSKRNLGFAVFIYRLPKIDKQQLKEYFNKYGLIINCGVNGDKGFVNYETELSALKAVKNMNKKNILGKKITVVLKKNKN